MNSLAFNLICSCVFSVTAVQNLWECCASGRMYGIYAFKGLLWSVFSTPLEMCDNWISDSADTKHDIKSFIRVHLTLQWPKGIPRGQHLEERCSEPSPEYSARLWQASWRQPGLTVVYWDFSCSCLSSCFCNPCELHELKQQSPVILNYLSH